MAYRVCFASTMCILSSALLTGLSFTEKINPSFSIKILSKEDVIEGSYFKKSIEALWYLHQKGYSLAGAEEIVSSLQGIKIF